MVGRGFADSGINNVPATQKIKAHQAEVKSLEQE